MAKNKQEILNNILNEFSKFEEVQAIGIGGSGVANTSDNSSDIDVYAFVDKDVPIKKRSELIKKYSSNYEIGCNYFGAGDEFYVNKIEQQLDVMYFNKNWFEDNFNNVWINHNPSNGYTTCFLYTLNILDIKYDPKEWLQSLKEKLQTPYPQELKENIIKRNFMLLKDKPFASYYEQIEKALKREDINSVNHRIAAFLAGYFDIIFAKNELLHPGEKRLIKYAKDNCKILPDNFEQLLSELLRQPNKNTLPILDCIIDNLRKI